MHSAQNIQPDLDSAEEAVRRWADTVWRLTKARLRNEADASDAFQDTFLALCRAKPSFESLEHQKAWLLRTACNCCNQIVRKRATHPAQSLEGIDVPAKHSNLTGKLELEETLGCLTDAQRTAVHLFYFEGYQTGEIAAITGERPSTVRSHLRRARQALRLELENKDGGDPC